MAKDVNGKELKVGDKVRALTNGGYGEDVKVGGIYTITSTRNCTDRMGAHIHNDFYMYSSEIELVEEEVKEEAKLTPKLIESLVELEIGDYFLDSSETLHKVMEVYPSNEYPIVTVDSCFNLEELQDMGAYKVKVEPLEMVEVEEVKPKLYELVEGEDYVKLERGDIVKFADGNTHGVHAVDDDDHPYCMYFMGDSWWVESHYFLPENIITINGVNIHEEYVGDAELTDDPYEGWVEGAKVKCLKTEGGYEVGGVYTLGWCEGVFEDNDFGVKTEGGLVLQKGCLSSDDKQYINKDILDYFELVKE